MGGPGSGRKKGSGKGRSKSKVSVLDSDLMKAYGVKSKASLNKIGKTMSKIQKANKSKTAWQ